jgi:general secretion pathway protein G
MKKAFTMVELVFVIVVLGILSSIAVSKMAVTRDDAMITNGRAQVAGIRNAITLMRNTNMLQALGAKWPARLDALNATEAKDGEALFGYDTNASNTAKKLLDYPVYAKDTNGHWKKVAANKYAFKVMNVDVNFTYTASSGQFDCTQGTANNAQKYCKVLTE